MSLREIKKTEVGKEYQIEVLSKEVRWLKASIKKQISLFKKPGPNFILNAELDRLNKTFSELSNVSDRLSPLISEEDAKGLQQEVMSLSKDISRVDKEIKSSIKVNTLESPKVGRRLDLSVTLVQEKTEKSSREREVEAGRYNEMRQGKNKTINTYQIFSS